MSDTHAKIQDEAPDAPADESSPAAHRHPSHDEIAVRAYELYCQWGREDGHAVAHWLEAERQLLAEGSAQSAP